MSSHDEDNSGGTKDASGRERKKGRKAKRTEKKKKQNLIDSSISLETLLKEKSGRSELRDEIYETSDYPEKVCVLSVCFLLYVCMCVCMCWYVFLL